MSYCACQIGSSVPYIFLDLGKHCQAAIPSPDRRRSDTGFGWGGRCARRAQDNSKQSYCACQIGSISPCLFLALGKYCQEHMLPAMATRAAGHGMQLFRWDQATLQLFRCRPCRPCNCSNGTRPLCSWYDVDRVTVDSVTVPMGAGRGSSDTSKKVGTGGL
jgi:hypothetical protein